MVGSNDRTEITYRDADLRTVFGEGDELVRDLGEFDLLLRDEEYVRVHVYPFNPLGVHLENMIELLLCPIVL